MKKNLTAIIIDSNNNHREHLCLLLKQELFGLTVTGCFEHIDLARPVINTLQPDIIFIDPLQCGGDGFKFAKTKTEKGFEVVFVTTPENQKINNKLINHKHEFLQKPVDAVQTIKRIVPLIETALRKKYSIANLTLQQNRLLTLKNNEHGEKKIILNTLAYMESANSQVRFNFADGSNFLVSKTLKVCEEEVYGCGIYRVQKSFLVNILYIERLKRAEGIIYLKAPYTKPIFAGKEELWQELINVWDNLIY